MSSLTSGKTDFLVEIGTEELPPKALRRLSEAFTAGITSGLADAGLGHTEVKSFAAPRRLAVLINDLRTTQPDREELKRGPALTAAFGDDGCPSKAAEGFARSCGVASVDDLEKMETDKGAWLAYRKQIKGQAAADLLPDIVRSSLDKLPIPKRMRWGAGNAEFVRPVHWVVLLLGDKVIETEILGIKTDRTTVGHRFHQPKAMSLFEPQGYAPLLESQGHVIADFDTRRKAIRAQVEEIAIQNKGKAVIDDDLLDEVTSMVEWPLAVLGNFDERFLQVPAECLISSMKGHQKYFHMLDADGKLMANFITVSNIDSSNIKSVREGNERVIRPRLSDAEFFWQQDCKHSLSSHLESLKTVVFQKQLGTLHDKAMRIGELAASIAQHVGADPEAARQAGQLAKCDLMSEMVHEFPELQGIMGRYYAKKDGEPDSIANAIEQHYWPRFAGDALPDKPVAQATALADKLDSLVGIFGIGQPPSGDKDPFALRRAALGVLRITLELDLHIDLPATIATACKAYTDSGVSLANDTAEQVFDFILGRLPVYYANQDFAADVIDSVISLRPAYLNDLDKRLRAVAEFIKLPAAESLAAANKRIGNILKKVDGEIPANVDDSLFEDDNERALANTLTAITAKVTPLLENSDYTGALTQLASLREDVDRFFDHVMVMADDSRVRNNRLALLSTMRDLFLDIADLSRLQG
jgi:glycyl-tRNA synthetase beta chain